MLTKQLLPPAVLKDILSSFNLSGGKTHPLKTSGNISYIIKKNSRSYFLRLCPDGHRWRSKGEILAEIELLGYLKARRLPIQIPLRDSGGHSLISWNNHFGYVRSFEPGKEKMTPSLAEVEKFGNVLGRLHTAVEGFKTHYPRKHVFDLAYTKKYFLEDTAAILKSSFPRKRNFVREYKKQLFSLSFPPRLPKGTIHEDLGKRHVLWRGGKITSLIDFDRSYFGFLLLDLAQACRGWCFVNNWKRWSNTYFFALLSGYSHHRKLSTLEKKYFLSAVKFAILERSLAFALRYVYVNRDKKDAHFSASGLFEQIPLLESNETKIESILNQL